MRKFWKWLLLPCLVGSVASAEPNRKLTLTQTVEAAIDASPRLRAARARQEAAAHTTDSARGRMLPLVHVSDEQQHFDSPFSIPFGAQSVVARDVNTNTFSVALNQPLVGLARLNEDHEALSDSADSAAKQVKALESGIRESVHSQYLRLFEALATVDIARSSQTQLKEQIGIAQSRLNAGVLTNADVLRVQVALANAQQQEIQANTAEQIARAALFDALGLPPDDATVDFIEPNEQEMAAGPVPSLTDAVMVAEKNRPEIQSARFEVSAAAHRSKARLFNLLPELSIEAAYAHITGQIFAPANQAYLGLKLDWNIWESGTSWYARKAAESNAAAADADALYTRQQIGLDVSTKLAQGRSAANAVDVAKTAITSAEEAYRVTNALVQAGSATTTDLLDAQSALTQSKLNLVRARYEQAIVNVSIQRAMGRL